MYVLGVGVICKNSSIERKIAIFSKFINLPKQCDFVGKRKTQLRLNLSSEYHGLAQVANIKYAIALMNNILFG